MIDTEWVDDIRVMQTEKDRNTAFYVWCVRRVCLKYGVRWFRKHVKNGLKSDFDHYLKGKRELRTITAGRLILSAMDAAQLIHEVIHVTLGEKSFHVCEGYVLLPFEWRVVCKLAEEGPHVPEARKKFLDAADYYQEATGISFIGPNGPFETNFKSYMRDEGWYKEAEHRAVRLGLLTPDLKPTWKPPQWKGSGVPNKSHHRSR